MIQGGRGKTRNRKQPEPVPEPPPDPGPGRHIPGSPWAITWVALGGTG